MSGFLTQIDLEIQIIIEYNKHLSVAATYTSEIRVVVGDVWVWVFYFEGGLRTPKV